MVGRPTRYIGLFFVRFSSRILMSSFRFFGMGYVRKSQLFLGCIIKTVVFYRLTTLWWFPSEIERTLLEIVFVSVSLLSTSGVSYLTSL